MLNKLLWLAGLMAASLVPGAAAQAVVLNGSYTVTANGNADLGLGVVTLNDFGSAVGGTTNSFSNLSLAASGFSLSVDLFELYTPEDPIVPSDAAALPISVRFDFTGPSTSSGSIGGTTMGLVDLQEGRVHWSNPTTTIAFNDGTGLRIDLLDTEFGSSFNGVVIAQFTAQVPEPGTWALLAAGLVATTALRRRRAVALPARR